MIQASPISLHGVAPPAKRLQTPISHESQTQLQPLLPGLPDHVAQLPLSLLPPPLLYSVCRSWRRVLYSPSFPPFLSLYALSLHDNNSLLLSSFDPLSSTWLALPPPPSDPTRRLILRHPSFLSRQLSVQSVSLSGNLVLLAATADNLAPAFSRPLIFSPTSKTWKFGPKLNSPRRWCVGGSCAGALYAASGVGGRYSSRTARSVEKFHLDLRNKDLSNSGWEKLRDLESEKMSREALGAVGWREKLLVADVMTKEGTVYDVKSDMWCEMPDGMIGGWRGPAAAMDEETLYTVDGSNGILRRYDADGDCWEDVMRAPELKGAEQITAGGGRVCVLQSGGGGIVVVDVVAFPAKFWIVDSPRRSQTIAFHILPRISRSDL